MGLSGNFKSCIYLFSITYFVKLLDDNSHFCLVALYICRNPSMPSSMEFGGTEQNSCAEVSYKNASLANGNNLK